MSVDQPLDERRQQLDETQQKLDQLVENAKENEKELRQAESAPESLSVPPDTNEGPHLPGLG
jgi:hypothetical protein